MSQNSTKTRCFKQIGTRSSDASVHPAIHLFRETQALEPITNKLSSRSPEWLLEYLALLRLFTFHGYRFLPVGSYQGAGMHKNTVFLRHDIHQVDIGPALELLNLHTLLDIRSTFYILWHYRKADILNEGDYLLLNRYRNFGHEFGFHEAALDNALFAKSGSESPETIHEHVRSLVADTRLLDVPIESFLRRDPNGIERFSLERMRSEDRLAPVVSWIERALQELEEKHRSFSEKWGSGHSLHTHGGYATAEFRGLSGYPRNFRFVQKFHERKKADWTYLLQIWRFLPPLEQGKRKIPIFANEAVESEITKNRETLDLFDGRSLSVGELFERCCKAIGLQANAFVLVHPALWESDRFSGLSGLVDRHVTQHVRNSAPSRQYNLTALKHSYHVEGHARIKEKFSDTSQFSSKAATEFNYFFSSVPRILRVESILRQIHPDFDLNNVSHFIDIGCGTGVIGATLSARNNFTHSTFIDIDGENLAVARRVLASALPRASYSILEQSFDEDFAEGQLPPGDFVLAYGSFEYFVSRKSITSAFQNLGLAIAQGGVFLANIWNHHYRLHGHSHAPFAQYLPTQSLRIAAGAILGSRPPHRYFRSQSISCWKRLLNENGFSDIRFFTVQMDFERLQVKVHDLTQADRSSTAHIWVSARKI